jgi:hypothetical protein
MVGPAGMQVETELPTNCILSIPIFPEELEKVLEYQGVTTGTRVAKIMASI